MKKKRLKKTQHELSKTNKNKVVQIKIQQKNNRRTRNQPIN